jgi:hypothetical protein
VHYTDLMSFNMRLRRLLKFVIILIIESPLNFLLHETNKKLKLVNHLEVLNSKSPPPQGTSISDSIAHIGFLQLCNLAVEEEVVIKHFRSNTNFTEILENVDYWRGHQYAGKIRKYRFDIKKFVNLITNFDSVGNPMIYKYRGIPKCSPTLLRYISVYLELKTQNFESYSKFLSISIISFFTNHRS